MLQPQASGIPGPLQQVGLESDLENQFLQQGRRHPAERWLPICPASCPSLFARPCPNRQVGLLLASPRMRSAFRQAKGKERAWGWWVLGGKAGLRLQKSEF